MTYRQTYSYREHDLGDQTVHFVVSNNYDELFGSVFTAVNIFNLDTSKQSLNIDEGSFAVDELAFSVNHLSCESEEDKQAMYFCLDASNYKVNRYCALIFGDVALSNAVFVGKINTQISAEDKYWNNNSQYEVDVKPYRDYKLSAFSFDIAVLEKCKIKTGIKDESGTYVKSIFERMKSANFADLKAKFSDRLAYKYTAGFSEVWYRKYSKLAYLWDVLDVLLSVANDIAEELTNTPVSFSIRKSSIGIKGSPFLFDYNADEYYVKGVNFVDNQGTELLLSNADNVPTSSSIMVHYKLIKPELFTGLPELSGNESNEIPFAFENYDNIADLLYDIARSLGCYMVTRYNSAVDIEIKFVPRSELVESDLTYIHGVTSSDLDVSSIAAENKTQYYSVASNLLAEKQLNNKGSNDILLKDVATAEYEAQANRRKRDAERKGVEWKQLLFSLSSPIKLTSYKNNSGDKLYEVINTNRDYAKDNTGSPSNYLKSYLLTSLFAFSDLIEPAQLTALGQPACRPIAQISSKINGKNEKFTSLADYINRITANDKLYYETEMSLTVPFWNGFSKSSTGSSPSWKNIKLGSKLKFVETVQRYEYLYKGAISITGTTATVTYNNHGLATNDEINVTSGLYEFVIDVITNTADYLNQLVTVAVTKINDNQFSFTVSEGVIAKDNTVEYFKPGVRETIQIDNDYIVVDIERTLSKPETKIKLHNSERFAFGYNDGHFSDEPMGSLTGGIDVVLEDAITEEYEVENDIDEYDAVQLTSTGTIQKGTSHSSTKGSTIGITLNSGTNGDKIRVMTAGTITNPSWNWSNTNTDKVFLRQSATSNVSDSPLIEKSIDEDSHIVLGVKKGTNGLLLKIREMQFK